MVVGALLIHTAGSRGAAIAAPVEPRVAGACRA